VRDLAEVRLVAKEYESWLPSLAGPFGKTIGSGKVGNGSDLRHKCLEPELSGTARKETSTLPSAHVRIWHFSEVVLNPGFIRLEIQIGYPALRVDRYPG
jgi:hypothetical protein